MDTGLTKEDSDDRAVASTDPAPDATDDGLPPMLVSPETTRRLIIAQSKRAGVGHIASSLSVADVVSVLFGRVLRGVGTDDPDRDCFILSKGHAALSLYVALTQRGLLTNDELERYCEDGSLLGVHPDHHLRGVDFSTGSLGHGLSIGAGVAFGARLRRSPARVFVLVSDAELNEGSTWEAMMFAGHHRLVNLVAILDDNGQQALGRTAEVLNLQPVAEKWSAFGWSTVSVDGHDTQALGRVLLEPPEADKPRLIVTHTVAGKGVSFMEGRIEWHYLPMSDDQYRAALEELTVAEASR